MLNFFKEFLQIWSQLSIFEGALVLMIFHYFFKLVGKIADYIIDKIIKE